MPALKTRKTLRQAIATIADKQPQSQEKLIPCLVACDAYNHIWIRSPKGQELHIRDYVFNQPTYKAKDVKAFFTLIDIVGQWNRAGQYTELNPASETRYVTKHYAELNLTASQMKELMQFGSIQNVQPA